MPVAIFSCDTIKTKWDKSNQVFTLYNKQTLFKQIILSYKICQGIEEIVPIPKPSPRIILSCGTLLYRPVSIGNL